MDKSKQGRTVFTPELHDLVRDILQHPGSTLYGTSNDRWWVKQKGFTLSKDSDGVVRVHCKEKGSLAARPVALVDELFGIIEAAHVGGGKHLGRDKTFEVVQKGFAKLTKDLVRLYINLCPTCSPRWSKSVLPTKQKSSAKSTSGAKAKGKVGADDKDDDAPPPSPSKPAKAVIKKKPSPILVPIERTAFPTPPTSRPTESTSSQEPPFARVATPSPPPPDTATWVYLPPLTLNQYSSPARDDFDFLSPVGPSSPHRVSPSPFLPSTPVHPSRIFLIDGPPSVPMSRATSTASGASTLSGCGWSDAGSVLGESDATQPIAGAAESVDFGEWLSGPYFSSAESGTTAHQAGDEASSTASSWEPSLASFARGAKRAREQEDEYDLASFDVYDPLDEPGSPSHRNFAGLPFSKRRYVDLLGSGL
ncbi:hypothetical protein Rhopal_006990-T1 [Rhodotorula paludigena]|uniref:Integrase zinc-binding domain-containing protein n=1 Tax=Rhodotorula paludigena TaxID=86838 RepID=A0AAV5GMX1_9BASI|nr:hypothetical protein Rhopal_006990-T1 [Rhodotorula paludigena]